MSLKKLTLCVLIALTFTACGEEDTNTNNTTNNNTNNANPAVTAGKAIWDANSCAGCHGADGKGSASFPSAPDLTSAKIDGKPDAELKASIKNGKGSGMPAYSSLTDEQLTNVVAYIRSL
jgi:mono/diheme cytochrome c family protein